MDFTINKKTFLNWAFNSGSDQEREFSINQLGEMIFQLLLEQNSVTITTEDLFSEALTDSIPLALFEEYHNDSAGELGDLKVKYNIKLIN